ncbi:unnamed protein product [Phytomonas sp. EM1]|nr:unnamed protein product [Phytomonas sp. EM1]|eukprot:CCW64430.1 unnamed protein product [Phytomonas sp. isolate EM1]
MPKKSKKDKIPYPGTKGEPFTEFYSRKKWRTVFQSQMLDLAGRGLSSVGTLIIGTALAKNHTISYLNLAHNDMGDDGAIALADLLRVNETIHTLDLSQNCITDVGAIALASAFLPNVSPSGQPGQWNRTLTSLILVGNECGDDTLLAFSNAAVSHHGFSTINLSWNRIGAKGTRNLMRCFQHNPLCNFILYANQLGDEGVVHLCEALRLHGGKGQGSLNLYRNSVGPRGAAAVAALLDGNDYLLELDLSSNTLGLRGTQEICRVLTTSTCVLRTLNLADNMIGDDGAKEVARVISANLPTLNRLNVSDNEINEKGSFHLVNALHKNTSLLVVQAGKNTFGSKAVKSIEELVRTTKSLCSLNIMNCVSSPELRWRLSLAVGESDGVHVEMGNETTVENEEEGGILARINEYVQGLEEQEAQRAREATAAKKLRRSKSKVA